MWSWCGQFHVLTQFPLCPQFDTVCNPVMISAGSGRSLLLSISVNGNIVNITAGLDLETMLNAIYTDNQVAIYQIDKILLPFEPFAPIPAKPAEGPDDSCF
ncbi:hypothetical protein RCOM_0550040 [Ricinus communis]|uniref:Uncharacterized protein n=1 Tax=Ricinus communis TaxID=3988 RepID=B9T2Y3_RICCO|nr:hypothetical protein RCOM_0550040 [Ricinus communis]